MTSPILCHPKLRLIHLSVCPSLLELQDVVLLLPERPPLPDFPHLPFGPYLPVSIPV